MFVDETGTTTSMTRLRGWGRKGKPLLGKAPHGHWITSTFVAGLAHDGILAPMLIDTPPSASQRCFASRNLGRLRPTEQLFAKLKAPLVRAAPRSFDAIVKALKHILERFQPAKCANYLRHSGYVQA